MVFFIHIPKTAGTTFYDIVKQNHKLFLKPKMEAFPDQYLKEKFHIGKSISIRLPGGYHSAPQTLEIIGDILAQNPNYEEELEFIGGHVGYGFHDMIKQNVTYVSYLREPKARIFSDFKEHHKKGRFFYETLKKNDFSLNLYLELLLENGLDNLLTRQLAGPYDFFLREKQMVTPIILEQALLNSKNIVFFDMNQFDESLYVLNKRFKWKKTSYKKRNVSFNTKVVYDYDTELMNEIIKYDVTLYHSLKDYTVNAVNLNLFQKLKLQFDNFKVK